MSCKYIIYSYIYNKIIANVYTRTVLCVWTFAKTGYNIFSYKTRTDFFGLVYHKNWCRTQKWNFKKLREVLEMKKKNKSFEN